MLGVISDNPWVQAVACICATAAFFGAIEAWRLYLIKGENKK